MNKRIVDRDNEADPQHQSGLIRPVPGFRLVSADRLLAERSLKSLRPLIHDILFRNTLVGMVGPSESFKSAIALSMLASTASGVDWYGHKVSTGAVVALAAEGNEGYSRRLLAWQIDRATSLAGAPLLVSNQGLPLSDSRKIKRFADFIERRLAKVNQPPKLVLIDTVNRNFGGGDENSAGDMGHFIENVDAHLRRRFKCTVLLAHHTGHGNTGRARGSSAFHNALDTELLFSRRDDEVCMKCTKSKDAPPFDDLNFKLRLVDLPLVSDQGNPERSIVLDRVDSSRSLAGGKQGPALRVLVEMADEVRAGGGSAPVRLRDWRRRVLEAGIVSSDHAFDKLKTRLKAKRLIVIAGSAVQLTEGHK